MAGHNGSLLIDPTPQTITLTRALPSGEMIALQFPIHPDPRTCPANYQLQNELLLALAGLRAQVNAMASQLAVLAIAVGEGELETPEARERVALALHNVREIAAQCTIATSTPSALDGIAPS